VEDLGDMTYEGSILFLVLLMYVTHEDRWLDLSLCNLTGDWPQGPHKGPHRVEEHIAILRGPSQLAEFVLRDAEKHIENKHN
jgi:enoyl reductase-like protein